MKPLPFLVTRDVGLCREYIASLPSPRVAVYGRHGFAHLNGLFDRAYSLDSLYRDETFFDALATVTGSTTLVIVDVGTDYHCSTPSYIKPYTKLKPLSLQAARVHVVDRLAFYYSRKSILRPFLYLHGNVFPETLQEFYGVGPYAGNTLSDIVNIVPRVRSHMQIETKPIPIVVKKYVPTSHEVAGYEALKQRVIMDERRPKAAVVNALFKYINSTASKLAAVDSARSTGESVVITNNDGRNLEKTYLAITGSPEGTPAVFFDSGVFKLDMAALESTLGAIQDHNAFLEAMSG